MRIIPAALSGTLILTFLSPSALAAEFGTREEAVAMVKRVQARVNSEGIGATVQAIASKPKEFIDRDLYPFIIRLDGIMLANPSTPPSITGSNVNDLRDQDGKFFVRTMLAIARDKGSGWVDYRWLNPVTKAADEKSAYIERLGDRYLVGVGIYKSEQPSENTIGLISGSPNDDDTSLQVAYDLAEQLNDGDSLRILPIAGIGGPRNIRDVRYVKGIDIGLTQTDVLNNLRRSNERMGQVENKIVYIAKLFNEEVHLVAGAGITSINQLKGRKVNLDAKGSGTGYSMRDIFRMLNIEVEEVSMSQAEAIEKVRSGQIAATALIAGKPVRSMSRLSAADGLHFLAVPYPQPLIADYLPTSLTHDDYPDLIPAGRPVETVAVGAVLITYNWPKTGNDRYQRIEKFVEAFFAKIDDLKKSLRHPKWQEVNLAATLPGWTRFETAQNWLDRQRVAARQLEASNGRQTVAASDNVPSAPSSHTGHVEEKFFREFLRWQLRRQPAEPWVGP
jgi:TRAP-type uncharacterized transport system substrate-binding protein